MCGNIKALILFVNIQSDVSLLRVRSRQHRVVGIWIDCYQPLQIRVSLNRVNQPHLVEIVDVSTIFQHNNDSIQELKQFDLLVFCQADRPHLSLEAQLSNTLESHIVPEEYFIRWELRPLSTADKGENIGPEKHLNDANSATEPYHNK